MDSLILFVEASLDQMKVIQSALDDFCIASSQKVNSVKSQLFVSKNVPNNLAKKLCQKS